MVSKDPRQDPDYITQEMLSDAAEATGYDDLDEDRVRSALREYAGLDTADLKKLVQERRRRFERAGGRGVALADEIDDMRMAIAARRRSPHYGGNMRRSPPKRSSRPSRRGHASHGNLQREACGEYHTRTGKVGAIIHRGTSRDRVSYSYIGAWGAGSGLSAADMRREVENWRARKRGMKTIHPFVE